MKSYKLKKFHNYLVRILATMIVVIIISCSMTIESVVQPSSVNGGSVLPVTLNVQVTTNQSQTSKLMIAMLVPKLWNVANKASITFTSDITTGAQPMTVIPINSPAPNGNGLNWPNYLAAKIGNGGNRINDWEWVAFYSNADFSLGGNVTVNATVSIRIPVSNDNISFKLGYVVANSTDGLSESNRYGSFFPGCFTVNGTGDLIDFCNPQLATVEPRTASDNDIITIGFDGGVAANLLENASTIYLCATGITTSGTRIDVCSQVAASKLNSLGAGRWNVDIWPRKFFSLADNQQLEKLEYFFTDAAGANKVGYGGGKAPFLYTFKCQ
ncbi:MAG: hypothetical protein JWP81_5379 [Ferruginibacter sp.]|nr:hypothetical protein [Ferruginibacter sp.]